VLGDNLSLPPVFQSDLSDILRLLVVTQSSAFNAEEGHFVADRLRPFIERVRHLLEGDAAKNWTAEDIARTNVILGDALSTVGEQSGANAALSESIELYNEALTGFTRQQYPLEWAATQNNLGNALRNLGERESGTQHLTEAVFCVMMLCCRIVLPNLHGRLRESRRKRRAGALRSRTSRFFMTHCAGSFRTTILDCR
jgi:hypothetical protein